MRLGRSVAVIAVMAVAVGGGAWAFQHYSPDSTPSTDPTSSASPPAPTASVSPSPEPREEPRLAWGPTEAEWEAALELASSLDVAQVAGQVLVMSWNSPDGAGAASAVSDLHLGGVIVMGDAVVDSSQVSHLTTTIAGGGDGRGWPVMIGVDHEGGTVARLDGIVPNMPAFAAAGAAVAGGGDAAVEEAFAFLAADMAALGFTVDYAPVADVTMGLADPTIRTRSASDDAEVASRAVVATVNGMVAGGIAPTAKHFPGHGSVSTDSHHGLPVSVSTVEHLRARDFVPFERAIEAGVPSIMMGHIVVPEWGEAAATVNPAAYEYLRDEMGFTGLIVTDALNMKAISDTYGSGAAAVAAIAAGADVALMPADIAGAHAALVAAVNDGTLSRERIDEAAARSILMAQWIEGLPAAPRDLTEEYALTYALAGMSVSTAQCGAPLVTSPVHISGGFEWERESLAGFLLQHDITQGRGGSTVQLIGGDEKSGSADVVVALGGPWGLPASTASTYVGLYGRNADAYAALAGVLAGAREPGGGWPYALGLPYAACASP